MKICKFCQSEFEQGSGSFCSRSCQGKYAVKVGKSHIGKAEYGRWKCNVCGFIAESRAKLFKHTKLHRVDPNQKYWNKGLTKETDPRVKKCGETYSQRVKEGKIIPPQKGVPILEEVKKKISESMKKAHAEGRAHNIGTCRWNNKPSYPEQFFMKVIQNEFSNKNYQREFPFYKYSLDFAWIDQRKAIEIDGEQHERFKEYKQRDQQKDKLLKENNWEILRIKWKDIIHNTKYWIQLAKNFIDN